LLTELAYWERSRNDRNVRQSIAHATATVATELGLTKKKIRKVLKLLIEDADDAFYFG
jgi:hypothetical protein